jgi:hypothetical protein
MADMAQEQASEGDVDHCFGDVDAGLVVAHEPAPTEHSGGSALSGKELARCRTLRLGPFPVPPHKNHS